MIKGTGESTLVMDSPVPLMQHDPDRSWITDPDPDHSKGMQPSRVFQIHVSAFCFANACMNDKGFFLQLKYTHTSDITRKCV